MDFDGVVLMRPAGAAPLGGLRLVERMLFTLARAGARRLLCLGPRPPHPLRAPDAVPITWLPAVDGLATWARAGAGQAIVVDAATVIDAEVLRGLAAAPGDGILQAHAAALVVRCPAAALSGAAATLLRAAESRPAALPGATAWTVPTDALLLRADTAERRARAQRMLFARLGRPGDGWFTRVVDRRISQALTRLLVPTGVAPNQITVGSILLGLTGGLLFARGDYGPAVAGSLLFLASTIVDGCDGEIARLTFRESRLGARLDLLGDNLVHLVLFGGIAFGLYTRTPAREMAALGGLLIAGVLLSMATVYWCFVRHEPTAAQRRFFEAFASREFAYLLVLLTIGGKLGWFLWMAACGTYLFVGGLLVLGRWGSIPGRRVPEA